MSERTPFVVPEEYVGLAREILYDLQPVLENLVVRAVVQAYRGGYGDGYLANPSNLDAESPIPEP